MRRKKKKQRTSSGIMKEVKTPSTLPTFGSGSSHRASLMPGCVSNFWTCYPAATGVGTAMTMIGLPDSGFLSLRSPPPWRRRAHLHTARPEVAADYNRAFDITGHSTCTVCHDLQRLILLLHAHSMRSSLMETPKVTRDSTKHSTHFSEGESHNAAELELGCWDPP